MHRKIASTIDECTASAVAYPITGISCVSATTLDYQVGHNGDDGYALKTDVDNTFHGADSTSHIGHSYDDEEISIHSMYGFFRFTNVALPSGSTISSAKLSLKFASGANYDSHTFEVAGRDSGNVTRPTTYDEIEPDADPSYPYTTARVDWDSIGSLSAGDWFDSPDIKTIIQEIIDGPAQGTWSSGNALMFVVYDTDTAETDKFMHVRTHDHASADAAKLEIVYT